jgi:hypothetical protein
MRQGSLGAQQQPRAQREWALVSPQPPVTQPPLRLVLGPVRQRLA